MDHCLIGVWVDENGKKVEMKSFFLRLYADEEMRRLDLKYSWREYQDSWQKYQGNHVLYNLARAQKEFITVKILLLAGINRGWCGVAEEELLAFLESTSGHWELDGLVNQGYLRKKKVMGTPVLFPTEHLLISQEVPSVAA